ncbi:integrase core domain-containing protein [Nocardia sp. NPDC050799]|uniref:integrase core domain-containing protein n=1 Tax=Nocardia sp. NPDC050799 TaxID=3154842 RepID=UPI0033C0AA4E
MSSPASRAATQPMAGASPPGVAYWSKYEHRWHVSPTANQHDAITAIDLALADYEQIFGRPLIQACGHDPDGNVLPVVTVVTDNGGPFRSFRFEAFITAHPELRHVRTRVRSPGQNGSRERGFGALKYERLFLEEIDDVLALVDHAEAYRVEYNTVRPHEAIAWNRPAEVHRGFADPLIPNFPETKTCQLLDAGHGDTAQSAISASFRRIADFRSHGCRVESSPRIHPVLLVRPGSRQYRNFCHRRCDRIARPPTICAGRSMTRLGLTNKSRVSICDTPHSHSHYLSHSANLPDRPVTFFVGPEPGPRSPGPV